MADMLSTGNRDAWHEGSFGEWQQGEFSTGDMDMNRDLEQAARDSDYTPPSSAARIPRTTIRLAAASMPEPYFDDASESEVTSISGDSWYAVSTSTRTTMPVAAGHTAENNAMRRPVSRRETEAVVSGQNIPCEFQEILQCDETFDARLEFDAWVEHHLNHIGRTVPKTRCTHCGHKEKFKDFWQRMAHIREHWLGSRPPRHRFPDMGLLKYMFDQKIITDADFRSECDRLPPIKEAPRSVAAAIQQPMPGRRQMIEVQRSDRSRRQDEERHRHRSSHGSSKHSSHHRG
jgi:hypothetical protein